MKVEVNAGGKDNGRLEEGGYPSRLVQIVTTGLHWRDDRDHDLGEANKIIFTFEYPTEMIEVKDGDNKPRLQSKTENLFLNEKSNVYKIVKALDPKADLSSGSQYDLADLAGKPCTTNIGTTLGGKAKITSVNSVMKGFPVPDQINPTAVFDFDEPDLAVFDSLMEWVQNQIKEAHNFPGSKLEALLGKTQEDTGSNDDSGEDVPF